MSRVRARLSRLPLRFRLVAGFSAATFVVLVAAGAFVYWRVEYALDRGLDTELAQATTPLAPLVLSSGKVFNRTTADATGVAWQVLATDGTVLDHGGAAGSVGLITKGQLNHVGTSPHTFDSGELLPVSHEPYRLRVIQLPGSPRRYLAVGVRRDHRDEALRELLAQLTLAGIGTLVVTAFVGDRLARAALRPVERYRRQAAAIAAGRAELRLDVPAQRDDEITRLGHTFNDMLGTLERALERERQFVSEASHELRTPITLLTGRIQLALRRPRTATEHERILTELEVDLDRLATLAEQLLELSAVDDRRMTDLIAVSARVINQRRLAGPDRIGLLTVQLPAHAVVVPLADFEIARIVNNLLDNAVLHGAPPYELTIDEPIAGWARLGVSDAGPGMAAPLLNSATQRFARADEARSRPGAGLGLALVGAVVGLAGGELRLCHGDDHSSHGGSAPVPCTHGPAMTVTILLPTSTEPP
ncbi:MAG: HAMP domain-containing protein [Kribbellaceae bacterium]|nr:HAMP domain-containing protein [Kribbellaceae bacterium]